MRKIEFFFLNITSCRVQTYNWTFINIFITQVIAILMRHFSIYLIFYFNLGHKLFIFFCHVQTRKKKKKKMYFSNSVIRALQIEIIIRNIFIFFSMHEKCLIFLITLIGVIKGVQ
jgi:hypothetical protein